MEIKKILVVDDELMIRHLFQRMFSREYQVSVAESGKEAIEMLKKETFDVVFIDVVMPGMDGVETLNALKDIKPDIVAIMMTGFAVENKIQTAMKLGAFDYIYKPFEESEIQAIFKKLEKREHLKKTD
ncbi:MAG: response regulator [Deltaproteobacteria bacterium]|nr:response regulator [Deltaproteobacteria bacterium]